MSLLFTGSSLQALVSSAFCTSLCCTQVQTWEEMREEEKGGISSFSDLWYRSLSEPGPVGDFWGFLQAKTGLQPAESSTMDSTNTQVNLKVDDPAKPIPPKIEISYTEAKWQTSWPHKLKPWDMNVLTPSGFWKQTSYVVLYFSDSTWGFFVLWFHICLAFYLCPLRLHAI